MNQAFALWLTGLPASGKTSVAQALTTLLHDRDVDPVVLDADLFRKHFMPGAVHSAEERLLFYQGLIEIAAKFIDHGVPVVIDATGNREGYRTLARKRLQRFAEVFVDCPIEVCAERDHKGVYRKGLDGIQAEYEAPTRPEVHLHTDREDPRSASRKVLDFLMASAWIPSKRLYRV